MWWSPAGVVEAGRLWETLRRGVLCSATYLTIPGRSLQLSRCQASLCKSRDNKTTSGLPWGYKTNLYQPFPRHLCHFLYVCPLPKNSLEKMLTEVFRWWSFNRSLKWNRSDFTLIILHFLWEYWYYSLQMWAQESTNQGSHHHFTLDLSLLCILTMYWLLIVISTM